MSDPPLTFQLFIYESLCTQFLNSVAEDLGCNVITYSFILKTPRREKRLPSLELNNVKKGIIPP